MFTVTVPYTGPNAKGRYSTWRPALHPHCFLDPPLHRSAIQLNSFRAQLLIELTASGPSLVALLCSRGRQVNTFFTIAQMGHYDACQRVLRLWAVPITTKHHTHRLHLAASKKPMKWAKSDPLKASLLPSTQLPWLKPTNSIGRDPYLKNS